MAPKTEPTDEEKPQLPDSAPDSKEQGQDAIKTAVERAKRAFALKKYEQAVEHYATALELMTQDRGDDAPETADLYFAYGKALLENAISQASVLGKEQPEDEEEPDPHQPSGSGGPILSFSGDADDEGVDLFGQAVEGGEEEGDEGDGGDDAEPEDDFNAAWEVLDLARAIYQKQNEEEEEEEVKLKLADTFITLGDVSLETEKFDQAITDYEAGLKLKIDLLPKSSRQIAEAHYKLSMVLDLTAGRLSDAIVHAEKALESVETRLAELRDGLNGQLAADPISKVKQEEEEEVKGKGKAKGKAKSTGARLVRDDQVQKMSKNQIEAEIKELDGLKEDLALKVEELKTTPNETHSSAPTLAAQALDLELNAGSSSAKPSSLPVNDLTSRVVKKKKKAFVEDGGNGKRKAEAERSASPAEKKPRLGT